MEIQRLLTGARTGNNRDFDTLVHLFYKKVYSTVKTMISDDDLAQDIVQDTFLRAWTNLDSLKESAAFPSWLWSIASNLTRTRLRSLQRERQHCAAEPDMDRHADRKSTTSFDVEEQNRHNEWTTIAQLLSAKERILAELRYIANLSLREIAAVLDISENLVKSRLYELRKKLRRRQWDFGEALHLASPDYPKLEEKIMDKLHALRLGAHVFERLALDTQVQFAYAVLDERKLDEATLTALGKVDSGTEFLSLYGTSLNLNELIGILNHVDRFTEMRLINHLDIVAPAQAEKIKQNMFVFEDLVMLDETAIRVLVEETNREILAVAVKGTDNRTRNHILESLSEEGRLRFEKDLDLADGGHTLVKSSQEFVINVIKDLEASGRLVLLRKSETEIIGFTARNP